MPLYLSPQARYIISHLNAAGFEGFAVGGCVRDMLMGREPSDWDIATNALPEQVKGVFYKTFDTGLQHGTVTVLVPRDIAEQTENKLQNQIEVTTYRRDGEYLDNRRPSGVIFEKDIHKDLSRRDFTVNAMAYNETVGLVDPFGGQTDLQNGIIRCVGEPERRFGEDALRMLRAIRFACTTGFEIEKETFEAIKKDAKRIKNISSERIRDELCKALLSNNPLKLKLLHDTRLDLHILPEFAVCFDTEQVNPYHLYNVGEHILKVVEASPKDLELRVTALLHDIGKPPAKTTDAKGIDHFKGHGEISVKLSAEIMRRLRFDNKTIANVTRLIKYHDAELDGELAVRRNAARVGADLFLKLIALQRADCGGQNPKKTQPKLHWLYTAEEYFNNNISQMALTIARLDIDGRDLMENGIAQGAALGKVLDGLLKAVIKQPELNNKELLLKKAREMGKF